MLPGAEFPASEVDIKLNWSFDSSHIIPILVSVPLSIINPESTVALPAALDDNTIIGSWTTIFDVLIVVVVPLTVKSPSIVKLPEALMLVASTVAAFIVPVVVRLLSLSEIPAAFWVVISLLVIAISPNVDTPPTLSWLADVIEVADISPFAP